MRSRFARRTFVRPTVMLLVAAVAVGAAHAEEPTGPLARRTLPNLVVILADDLGYGDLGCYGGPPDDTPHLDRMAAEGLRFTSFYVAQAVCGASRAALLSGCYPNRIGLLGAPNHRAEHGVHPGEWLLSEMCRERGCATAAIGKWHLGHRREFLPQQHGFDEYFGLPYSNDMWPFHPEAAGRYPPLPLIEGADALDADVTAEDQQQLTTAYTARAVQFIRQHRDQPFFLYVAHTMPHVPLFVSPGRAGASPRGLYGDVLREIDWSVGEILRTLEEQGLDENTLVLFTSDNGPWLSYGDHAGTAGPLREGKGTTWEGGVRVPCIARWPRHIPAGTTCDELAATIDILPTWAGRIGGRLPEHRVDGRDLWPLMSAQPGARTPHEAYFYYWGDELQAIRSGDWKLHFPHAYRSLTGPPGSGGRPSGYSQQQTDLALYNLDEDLGETRNIAAEHPDVVDRLSALAEAARIDLGDSLQARIGAGLRPAGRSTPDEDTPTEK